MDYIDDDFQAIANESHADFVHEQCVSAMEAELSKLRNALDVAERALDKVLACTKSKTISDILHGSDATILASGLNPYCMNEGRANGNELAFDYSDVFDTITTIKQARGEG